MFTEMQVALQMRIQSAHNAGPVARGIFERVDSLTQDAINSIRLVVVLAAVGTITLALFKGSGAARLVVVVLTAAAGIWLVGLSGIETLAEMTGRTAEG